MWNLKVRILKVLVRDQRSKIWINMMKVWRALFNSISIIKIAYPTNSNSTAVKWSLSKAKPTPSVQTNVLV